MHIFPCCCVIKLNLPHPRFVKEACITAHIFSYAAKGLQKPHTACFQPPTHYDDRRTKAQNTPPMRGMTLSPEYTHLGYMHPYQTTECIWQNTCIHNTTGIGHRHTRANNTATQTPHHCGHQTKIPRNVQNKKNPGLNAPGFSEESSKKGLHDATTLAMFLMSFW